MPVLPVSRFWFPTARRQPPESPNLSQLPLPLLRRQHHPRGLPRPPSAGREAATRGGQPLQESPAGGEGTGKGTGNRGRRPPRRHARAPPQRPFCNRLLQPPAPRPLPRRARTLTARRPAGFPGGGGGASRPSGTAQRALPPAAAQGAGPPRPHARRCCCYCWSAAASRPVRAHRAEGTAVPSTPPPHSIGNHGNLKSRRRWRV